MRANPSGSAYPRSRGENVRDRRFACRGEGLSPLTRGKRAVANELDHTHGLIPAHAGKTRSRTRPSGVPGAYPRSRGENGGLNVVVEVAGGLSPLTRGKPVELIGGGDDRGLIPAHAGKTTRVSRFARSIRAYPRSRGENTSMSCRAPTVWGLSPLTRGKRAARSYCLSRLGLIPAHAGKTPIASRRKHDRRAYPRSRGENMDGLVEVTQNDGLSPLTRGKPLHGDVSSHRKGLIPAHAGKTWPSRF